MQAGEQNLFLTFFLDSLPSLQSCLQMLYPDLDEETIKDCLQEASLDIITQNISFEEIQKPFAYILRICIRKAWKLLQRRQKELENSEKHINERQELRTQNQERIQYEQAVEAICGALDDLNDRDAKLVKLRFFEKLSFDEIASRIQVKNSNVARNAMSRAMNQLRNIVFQSHKDKDWWKENLYLSRFFHKKGPIQ